LTWNRGAQTSFRQAHCGNFAPLQDNSGAARIHAREPLGSATVQGNLYVGVAAQVALQKRLNTIAHNVANATTAGFRAEEVRFETLLAQAGNDSIAFSASGPSYLSRRSGEFVKTDNALDLAVEGDAWLAMQTPTGQAYTRDGRLRMTPVGELQTLSGHPILDAGGAPLLLDPNGGPPRIARDGAIFQGNRQVGAVGLFNIEGTAKLTRYQNSGVIPDRPATPVVDFTRSGVQQGFVENSNVNAVMEMTRLISVTRAFEMVSASLSASETSLQDAIKALGSTT
jgi:flagellar basal-body rod protein FlgF